MGVHHHLASVVMTRGMTWTFALPQTTTYTLTNSYTLPILLGLWPLPRCVLQYFKLLVAMLLKTQNSNWTINKSSVGQDGQGRERRAVLHDSSDHPGKYVCSRSRHPWLNVTMQVENRLFRVPRQSLESQSKIFRDMFSLPVAEDTEGSSDNNPIRLDGIKKEEFKRFLEVLFMG